MPRRKGIEAKGIVFFKNSKTTDHTAFFSYLSIVVVPAQLSWRIAPIRGTVDAERVPHLVLGPLEAGDLGAFLRQRWKTFQINDLGT